MLLVLPVTLVLLPLLLPLLVLFLLRALRVRVQGEGWQ